jgi:hypothetical protein
MIKRLVVERFKSVQRVDLPCKRVNVLLGPPDSGKSNILESLYFLSRIGWGWPLDTSLRLRPETGFEPLFFHQFFEPPLVIELHLDVPQPAQLLRTEVSIAGQERRLRIAMNPGTPNSSIMEVPFGGTADNAGLSWLRYYSFAGSESWTYATNWRRATELVVPPHGWNLLYIARHSQSAYDYLKDLVAGLGWKLRFDQQMKVFRLSEVRESEILDYNLDLLSDSLKRLFFYVTILRTSKGATLVFDEPDVYAFPPYPKTLGDLIAADSGNQYFLTTHNPYFLSSLVEKTPTLDLGVFVCARGEDGATEVRPVPTDRLPVIVETGASIFFNLN